MTSAGDPTWEERQLALLVRHAIDYAIYMLDDTGHVLTWNQGAERMSGYGPQEIIGRHFSSFQTDSDKAREHPAEILELAARDGRYEEEGWRVRKDGRTFWATILITAIRDEQGTLIGFGMVSRDTTARHLAEEQTRAKTLELEAANRQLAEYQRLVTSVRDYAIFMLDPGGHVLTWNAGARQLKGYEPDEIVGRHVSAFYTEDDRARGHPAHELEVAARDDRYEEEGWRVRKDGTTFWARVSITTVRDDAGRVTGYTKVTRDLSERRRSEQALQRVVEELRVANDELDRFASIAAHDMTDPLRTISGFAELLVESEPPPERAREFAGHILTTSGRLSHLLQSLLAYSRAGRSPGPGVPVDLAAAAGEALSDVGGLIGDRGAEVVLDVPSGARVTADPLDVRLVLQNLIANAVKFGAPDGPEVSIAATRVDGGWQVTVIDNGVGVAPEDHERIFRAFERTGASVDNEGQGLGLAICARLVARHGGTVAVDSARGAGSAFHVTLPAGEDAPPAPLP